MTYEDRFASPTHGHIGDYDIDRETNNLNVVSELFAFGSRCSPGSPRMA